MINSVAKNPSLLFKPNSDSSPVNHKRMLITPLMTTSVSMMKMDTFWTVFLILESSQKLSSNLNWFLATQRVEKILHLISILSLKLQLAKKAAIIHGKFLWLIPRITSNYFIQDQSEVESTKSEVLLMLHGTKSNAHCLETISQTSLKLPTGWNLTIQPTGKNFQLKRAPLQHKTITLQLKF